MGALMKILAVLQARTSSSRLPGKVLMKINGTPMIAWQIQRISKSKRISHLVVATSTDQSDDALAVYLERNGIEVYRGSLNDVHSRYLNVINKFPDHELIVRLTGDCPLVMPHLIDEMVEYFEINNFDYLSNCLNPTFPDGLDIEIFSRQSFLNLSKLELDDREKEHVTIKYRTSNLGFRLGEVNCWRDLGAERWTVDYLEDFEFVERVFTHFRGNESLFTFEETLAYLEKNPDSRNVLSHTLRNVSLDEGAVN